MKYTNLKPLPNDGYLVASNMFGVINNKILIGGGSGFIKPLAEGGSKLLSNSIRLIEETNGDWKVLDETKIVLNNNPYGFCNGTSISLNNVVYYIGGFKTENNGMVDSQDIIKVWVENNKLSFKVFENVLPFKGKTVGTRFEDNKAFIVNGNDAYIIDLSNDQFKSTKVELNNHFINGTLVAFDSENIYLFGGYKPFDKNNKDSNKFFYDNLFIWKDNQFKQTTIENFKDNPITFLDGEAIYYKDKLLLIGGVNNKMFVDAVYNLSTLEGDKLQEYRKQYFNKSEKEFAFNNKLVSFDIKTNKLQTLLEFEHGFAGNPSFVHLNNSFYILTSEIKAGVRLNNPIKFSLDI